jgi:cobalt-zinc-cadmium resistance protein CzcA
MFNSLRECMLTLSGIPFAIAGGVLALYFAGLNLSISAAIGFVSLLGVSVMNGILILTYFNHLVAEGKDPLEAMRDAAEQQMRPMLMMALSACIGLLPAALATGIGSQVQRPLATVVVGGMLLGPIMLLVVAPALQVVVVHWTARPRRRHGRPRQIDAREIDDEP